MILFSDAIKDMVLKVASKADAVDSPTLQNLISILGKKSPVQKVKSTNKLRYDTFTKPNDVSDPHSILESSASMIESYSSTGGAVGPDTRLSNGNKLSLNRPLTCLQRQKSHNKQKRSSDKHNMKGNISENSVKSSFNEKENIYDVKSVIPSNLALFALYSQFQFV